MDIIALNGNMTEVIMMKISTHFPLIYSKIAILFGWIHIEWIVFLKYHNFGDLTYWY